LIEAFDRFSREDPFESVQHFLTVLNGGLTVITVKDGRRYDKKDTDKVMSLLVPMLGLVQGNDFGERLKGIQIKSWEIRRNQARTTNRKTTPVAPAWLKYDGERGEFEIIPERQAIIDGIFYDLAYNNLGKAKIAASLNARGVAAWGPPSKGKGEGYRQRPVGQKTTWHGSYIQKITESRSVIGEYQPHKVIDGKRVPDGEPIANYFPSVIEPALYYAAQAAMIGRRLGTTLSGGRGDKVSNLFSVIGVCDQCGGRMTYKDKGKPPKGGQYLVCSNAIRSARNCYNRHHFNYPNLEKTFLEAATDFVISDDSNTLFRDLTAKIGETEHAISLAGKRLADIEATMIPVAGAGGDVSRLAKQYADEQAREVELRDTLASLKINREAASFAPSNREHHARLTAMKERILSPEASYEERTRAAGSIKVAIDDLRFCPDGTASASVFGAMFVHWSAPNAEPTCHPL
jgi:hypothetical protein